MPRSIGRYRILEKLGQGAMGAVFAARDETLGRSVAVKTIHKEIADETMRARMWREARAAARVSHPGVCQVYEVGEADGELFIAMELLEGEPLSTRMEQGALPGSAAIRIAIEILGALEALHGQGIVHRDLKPTNVFLTSHGVKVLDFGLALPMDDALGEEGQRLTQTGMMVGTPAFMAPEQWLGSDVGPAADLFAVGAILIELVTGKPAFAGKTAMDLYDAIARDPAPTLTGGPAIEVLDRVTQRALAKQPEDRPSSAAAMAEELRGVLPLVNDAEVPRTQSVRRLLVVPFSLHRPDDEIDYLGPGLADALVSSLSGRSDLVVKTSRRPARNEEGELDLAAIARETRVHWVLRGSLVRGGDRLRVSAQLVGVPEGEVVWSETRVTALDDVLAVQDDLAAGIAESLALKLESAAGGGSAKDVPATAKAYEYFLRANQLSYDFGMLPHARDLYRAALAEDPRFAPAWARLGRVHRVMAKYGHGDDEADRRQAEEAFRRALELNPSLATAHNLFAYYEIEELARPQDALVRLLEQARESPTDPDLLAGLVVACRFCGLLEASVEADRRVRRLDPAVRTSVAYTHWMRGDYEQAIRSDDEHHRWQQIYSLPMLGRVDEAIRACRVAEDRASHPIEENMHRSTRAALEGDRDACEAATRALFPSSFHDPEGLYYMARNATHVGADDLGHEILAWIVSRGFCCVGPLRSDPWLQPLREAGRLDGFIEIAVSGSGDAVARYRACGGEPLLGPVGDREAPRAGEGTRVTWGGPS